MRLSLNPAGADCTPLLRWSHHFQVLARKESSVKAVYAQIPVTPESPAAHSPTGGAPIFQY